MEYEEIDYNPEEADGEWTGRMIAKEDAKKYKSGEMTKDEIAGALEWARMNAAWGDSLAQSIGYYYLLQMEEEGIIKNLQKID